MNQPVDLNVPGVHLWLLLWKAYRAVERVDQQSIASTGLCLSDFAVLEVVLHKGALPVNEIGRKVLLSSGSMTTAVDRLQKRGLVERRACPTDRRVAWVHLTEAGRQLITEVFARHAERLEQVAGVLNDQERDQLAQLLRKLGKHAQHLSQLDQ